MLLTGEGNCEGHRSSSESEDSDLDEYDLDCTLSEEVVEEDGEREVILVPQQV